MRLQKAPLLAALTFPLLVTALAPAQERPLPPITLKETVTSLGRAPEGWMLLASKLIASPDLAHVGYAATKDGEGILMMDGKELARFECKEIKRLVFSPDSTRLACVVETKDYHSFAVVDGVVGPLYSSIGYLGFCFRPDSKSFAYTARDRLRNDAIVIDNKVFRTYVGLGDFVYSPDSKHFAYVANFGLPISGLYRWYVVRDSRRRGRSVESFLSHLTYSPDSKRFAYVVEADKLIVDGKEHPRYATVKDVTFSPDSKRLVHVATKGSRECIVLDGVEGPLHKYVTSAPVFSPDSARIAYSAMESKSAFVLLDGIEGKRYSEVTAPVFSPDSNHLAYGAKDKSGAFVVLDGNEGSRYARVFAPAFSPDSVHLAFVAETRGQALLVVDGMESTNRFASSVGHPPAYWMDALDRDTWKRVHFTSPTTVQAVFTRQPGPEFFRLEVQILPVSISEEEKP